MSGETDRKSVKDYEVLLVEVSEVKHFIERHHYSGSINGVRVSHAFGLYDQEKLIGAMVYGQPGMANAWKKYGESEADVVELRRLCCIDDTPKNTESYFIGATIRYLRKNSDFKIIVSYADPEQGHSGVIYQASNFKRLGRTSRGKVIIWGEKRFHDKSVRTYYVDKTGEKRLKPFAARLKEALDSGQAHYETTEGKNIYIYKLKG